MSRRVYVEKDKLVNRVVGYLRDFKRVLVVSADHVGSKHMQRIRLGMRPLSVLAMGKNTLLRRAIKQVAEEDGRPALLELLPHLQRNVGLLFTNLELADVKKMLDEDTMPAAARAGVVSDKDVVVYAGPSGLEPTKTSFLQAVGIASKINKGQIDIMNDTVLVKKGEKVSASGATLLGMLNILPFEYGLHSLVAYDDGAVFDAAVLDLTQQDIVEKFTGALRNVAAVSLAAGVANQASVPHSFINAFKNLVKLSLATDYTFAAVKDLKEILSDPTKLAAMAAASAAAPAAGGAEEKKEEPEEEEEEDADFGGGGLFGDDEDDDW